MPVTGKCLCGAVEHFSAATIVPRIEALWSDLLGDRPLVSRENTGFVK